MLGNIDVNNFSERLEMYPVTIKRICGNLYIFLLVIEKIYI